MSKSLSRLSQNYQEAFKIMKKEAEETFNNYQNYHFVKKGTNFFDFDSEQILFNVPKRNTFTLATLPIAFITCTNREKMQLSCSNINFLS